jgi:hypothetical protein
MPRLSARQARTREVVKIYLQHHMTRIKSVLRRKNKIRRVFLQAGVPPPPVDLSALVGPEMETVSITMTSDSSSEVSSGSPVDTELSSSSSGSSGDFWSDLLGSDWQESSTGTSTGSSTSSSSSGDDEEMPELHAPGYHGSESDSDSESDSSASTGSSSESDSGEDADDEDDDLLMDSVGVDFTPRRNNSTKWVRHSVEEMYGQRYEKPRDTFPRGPAFMRHVLGVMKNTRPDLFRQEVRMSPFTFDHLVKRIGDDPVFANSSSNAQMPVEDQLAITLFRFGHSGNAAGLQKVANWAGVGKGTITLVTRRVLTALLRADFIGEYVRMPTAAEKEKAKVWVAAHSCKAWRDGWCMVDGTLVALFDRPFWFGESYFDRKSNYSLNIQVRPAFMNCYVTDNLCSADCVPA